MIKIATWRSSVADLRKEIKRIFLKNPLNLNVSSRDMAVLAHSDSFLPDLHSLSNSLGKKC